MNRWIVFGLLGQTFFGMRFLVQWILSEIKKRSYVPTVFWYFSLLGGIMLFIYALHRKDTVFIIGQGMGLLIYSRNIVLIWTRRRASSELVKEI
ncbi:MAG: lipid A biosynthesis protein [Candidatus Makaraimicrobium thalassicum]|nr:MAG: lipid A biosynthesis protein [Candidatus Omnitrophota bacterium]